MKSKFINGNTLFIAFILALILIRLAMEDDPSPDPFLQVELTALDNQPDFRLDALAGQPFLLIYLNGEGEDCLPCLGETRYFGKLAEAYPDMQFVTVFASGEKTDALKTLDKVEDAYGLPGSRYLDPKGLIKAYLKLDNGHKFIICNREGEVVSILRPKIKDLGSRVTEYHEMMNGL